MDTFDESPVMRHLAVKLGHWNLPLQNLLNLSVLTTKREALWFLGKDPNKLYIISECPREYFVSYMILKVLRTPQESTTCSVR
jgi:hypothetical protein